MATSAEAFFAAYLEAFPPLTVYTDDVPAAMMASPVDADGWFRWHLLPGTLLVADYEQLTREYGAKLPDSFIEWHRAYYFLDGDCALVRLPESNPARPLQALEQALGWSVGGPLLKMGLYSFASEGNDAGPLVFDGRQPMPGNEFPIHVYDHEHGGSLEGLSPAIFSSFSKLLECMTHYLREIRTRPRYEVLPDFLALDPAGAGSTGRAYWLGWADMLKAVAEEFGE